ncbi:hypothetical protein FRC03_003371 [Tulasnella sp. 419]|nr:hypothetical protein FRC03_003371 [Tulasnella sp. 419]
MVILNPIKQPRYQLIYDLLASHASRWRKILIQQPAPEESHKPRTLRHPSPSVHEWLQRVDTPNLQEVELKNLRDDTINSWSLLDISVSNPVLQRLIITDMRHYWGGIYGIFDQIQYFRVSQDHNRGSEYFCDLMVFISEMKLLQDLRVKVVDFHEPNNLESIGYEMALSNLKTLRLDVKGACTSLWAWLLNLDAPELQHLHIWHEGYDIEESIEWHDKRNQHGWDIVRDDIQMPSVTNLYWDLGVSDSCPQCMAAFITTLPSIDHLTVVDNDVSKIPSALQHLSSFNRQSPSLKSIKLKGHGFSGLTKEKSDEIKTGVAGLNASATVMLEC